MAGVPRLPGCALCEAVGGDVVSCDDALRVLLPYEPDYPGFVRVVWNAHAAEMTDLSSRERERLMAAVWTAERVVRERLNPDKVNVASLGNLVAHVHWHVIPRWRDDRHFPAPIWGAPAQGRDDSTARRRDAVRSRVPGLREALARALQEAESAA